LATDAVFAVDDDIRVPCSDLEFAFGVWKAADQSLVGFMPRVHTVNPLALRAVAEREGLWEKRRVERRRRNGRKKKIRGGEMEEAGTGEEEEGMEMDSEDVGAMPPLFRYNGWWKVWWEGEYSLILTKAAFLHRDFLRAYTEEMPAAIRNYVDENRNCEDIAMQFLAANMTGKPPIFVRGRLTDLGVFNGRALEKSEVHAGLGAPCLWMVCGWACP